ncbi:hypothetical protein LCGC14_0378300 [marine sediment metagenome]|uniref:Uncharacterized protein n=1 Tax=marine sediment metagenome TaxID=412755 RepID=A0A0F9VQG4_9ZZZZ
MNPATRKVTRIRKLRAKLNKHAAAVTQILVFVLFAVLAVYSLRGISVINKKYSKINSRVSMLNKCIDEAHNRTDKFNVVLDSNTKVLLQRDEYLNSRLEELYNYVLSQHQLMAQSK